MILGHFFWVKMRDNKKYISGYGPPFLFIPEMQVH